MSLPVATVGCRFEGVCGDCNALVRGVLVSGAFVATIEGKNVCVTGSRGRGDCGHFCAVVGQSAVWLIEGKPVARVGDPVTGGIEGRIINGSDFVFAD